MAGRLAIVLVKVLLAGGAAMGLTEPSFAGACDGASCGGPGTMAPTGGEAAAESETTRGRQAAASDRAAWAVLDEADRLRSAGRRDEAAKKLEALARGCGEDRGCAAIALLGRAFQVFQGRQGEARPIFEDAEGAFAQLGDAKGEGRAWLGEALCSISADENRIALGQLEKALERCRAGGDRVGEARALNGYGIVWSALGERRKGLEYFEQALAIRRAARDRPGEAGTLNNVGNVWSELGEKRRALEYFGRALLLERALGDRVGEARTLNSIGAAWSALGEKRKALEHYEQALAIRRAVADRPGEAGTLNNIGNAWSDLGDKQKALEHFAAALSISRAVGDRVGEARTLINAGNVWSWLGEGRRALEQYEKALHIARAAGNLPVEASALNGMGTAWLNLGEVPRAEELYEQALPKRRAVGDRVGEARTLNNLGTVWSSLGERQKALDSYERALFIERAVGDRAGEARTLTNLARVVGASSRPQAILHAKQAVNLLQLLRSELRGIGAEREQSYAESISWSYRLLADLLVEDGQVLEAQRVMDLLKEDELNRLLKRSAPAGGSVRLTAAEKGAEKTYRKLTEALAETETRLATLRAVKEPTAETKSELATLEGTAESRREALEAYFAGLSAGLAKAVEGRERDAREMGAIQEALAELGEGSVAVYTIFGQEKVRLLVYGPETKRAREAAFDAKEVAKRIFALRQALTDPGVDAREASAKLYEVLVAPIAGDLEEAKAKTILWSLDGPLRYVPTAALWDAGREEWLAERYRSVEVTPASLRKLTQARAKSWKALGLGVTAKHGELGALKAVEGELQAVVKDASSPRGALPGRRLLDTKFTRDALFEELKAGWPVVHIASHYVFGVPEGAEEEGSYLLLGDGKKLSLKELSELERPVFRGVDLLALSACETGVGAEAGELSGAEVDGLAMVAQQRGAAGVLATLWPVDDPATAAFMAEFYGRLRAGDVTKAEALRQAQLRMLEGTVHAGKGGSTRALRRPETEGVVSEGNWSHPYYWAPFILLGNGR